VGEVFLHIFHDLPSPVGRIVIDDDDFGIPGRIFEDFEDERADVVPLVIGGKDHRNFPAWPFLGAHRRIILHIC
jgi:hypothetical protein